MRRNDAWTVEELSSYEAVVLSPGPGSPQDAGICVEAARKLTTTPLLGICLGHQAIGAAFGCPIIRTAPTHGRTSPVHHRDSGPLKGLPNPVRLTRYHSLAVDLPTPVSRQSQSQSQSGLVVDAWTADGIVMAVSHRDRPTWGVQPHPEAVLSEQGQGILLNFLRIAGLVDDDSPDVYARHDTAWRQRTAETPDFFAEPIDPAYPLPGPRNTR